MRDHTNNPDTDGHAIWFPLRSQLLRCTQSCRCHGGLDDCQLWWWPRSQIMSAMTFFLISATQCDAVAAGQRNEGELPIQAHSLGALSDMPSCACSLFSRWSLSDPTVHAFFDINQADRHERNLCPVRRTALGPAREAVMDRTAGRRFVHYRSGRSSVHGCWGDLWARANVVGPSTIRPRAVPWHAEPLGVL